MKKVSIPIYDICSIDHRSQKDLLIERFAAYLEKHYHDLHRPHRHSFFHFVIFTNGKGSHTIDFETFPVRPFQMYFMVPGQVHSWHFKTNVDGYIVHFNEGLFTSFLQNSHYLEKFSFFRGNASDGICNIAASEQERVIEIFETMILALEKGGEKNIDMIRIKLMELFILVDQNRDPVTKNAPPQKLVLLRTFQQLIDKHFRTIKLPKEYAELLYITPNHLNALCQDLVGKTAGDLIRERILLEAKRLLTNADMTVTEIAYDLNFADNSYFNRFFKKSEGLTPDEFRKKLIV